MRVALLNLSVFLGEVLPQLHLGGVGVQVLVDQPKLVLGVGVELRCVGIGSGVGTGDGRSGPIERVLCCTYRHARIDQATLVGLLQPTGSGLLHQGRVAVDDALDLAGYGLIWRDVPLNGVWIVDCHVDSLLSD